MTQALSPGPITRRVDRPVLPTPSLRRVFAAALRSEWTKLRTVRSTVWALIFTVASTIGIGALLTALTVSRWDARPFREAAGFDPLLYSFAGVNLAQLAVGVLGVLVMTSEYATGAIKLTLCATPQRRLLLAAKVATFSAVVAVVAVVSCVVTFLICQALLVPKHAGLSISDPGVARAVVGGAVHLVMVGAIAVGVGALLRRTAGAVSLLFGVLLILPGLVSLLPAPWHDDIGKYLPSSAAQSMSAVRHFSELLGPLAGLAVLCGYTVLVLLAASFALARRDA